MPSAIAKAKIAVCEIPGWLDAAVVWFVGLAMPADEDDPVALTVTVFPLTSLRRVDTEDVLSFAGVPEEVAVVVDVLEEEEEEEEAEVLEVVDVDVVVGFVVAGVVVCCCVVVA